MSTTPEGKFKTEVVKWLRSKGCFVWICKQDATTQKGVSDLFFTYEGFYGFLELKASKNAPRRPGQEAFVKKMNEWSWAKMAYPENWGEIKRELEGLLK